jgi:hypothetical protein
LSSLLSIILLFLIVIISVSCGAKVRKKTELAKPIQPFNTYLTLGNRGFQ